MVPGGYCTLFMFFFTSLQQSPSSNKLSISQEVHHNAKQNSEAGGEDINNR